MPASDDRQHRMIAITIIIITARTRKAPRSSVAHLCELLARGAILTMSASDDRHRRHRYHRQDKAVIQTSQHLKDHGAAKQLKELY